MIKSLEKHAIMPDNGKYVEIWGNARSLNIRKSTTVFLLVLVTFTV